LTKLPALERPTIAELAEKDWYSVTTIVDEYVVRDLIPDLIKCGATGIVEYPLNKIVL
jgi:ATP phosphoribosyltransferase